MSLTVENGVVVVNEDLSNYIEVLVLRCLLDQDLAISVVIAVKHIEKVICVRNTEDVLISKLKLKLRPRNL